MWIISFLVASLVAAITLAYAAFLPQITGESLEGWLALAAFVFVPWFVLAALFQRVRRIAHLGAARLFQVAALAIATYGASTSHAMDVPTTAAHFAMYGSLGLLICIVGWWVVEGFTRQRGK